MATKRRTSRSSAASSSKRGGSKTASAPSRTSNKQASTSARKRAGSSSGAPRASGASGRPKASGGAPQGASAKSEDGRGTVAKGLIGALAGAAAVGIAGRAAMKQRARRPKVLGMSIPRQLNTTKLDPRKVVQDVDAKKVIKQIGSLAEQVEAISEDVRMLSAQAKRLSEKLS